VGVARLKQIAVAKAGLFVRYAAGSLIAMACSEVVLIGSVGLIGLGATTGAVLAWAAGAAPNYALNRRWAWKKTGTDGLVRENAAYWVITIVTALGAIAATKGADLWLRGHVNSRAELSYLLGAAYFAAYGVVFVVKFVLFDKLVFTRREPGPRSRSQVPNTTRA
jgi:putative flippase GtrA